VEVEMTERAQKLSQKIKEVSWDWENMEPSHPHTIAVATLRELLSVFDDCGGDEYSNEVFREICEIANELEDLVYELDND
jgi:hypothetical protein